MRKAVCCFIILLLFCFTACREQVEQPDTTSSSSSNSHISVSQLMPCFRDCFQYNSFADIKNCFSENGVDEFFEIDIPEGRIPVTEKNSADRKKEIAAAFSGYTYAPYYDGKEVAVIKPIVVEIPARECSREYYNMQEDTDGYYRYTSFIYYVSVDTSDGINTNYGLIKTIHGKARKEAYLKSYRESKDITEVKQFALREKTVDCIPLNSLEYVIDYDDDTVIHISFDINLNYPYEFIDSAKSELYTRPMSQEFYSGEWLSKLSFKRIDFATEPEYRVLPK